MNFCDILIGDFARIKGVFVRLSHRSLIILLSTYFSIFIQNVFAFNNDKDGITITGGYTSGSTIEVPIAGSISIQKTLEAAKMILGTNVNENAINSIASVEIEAVQTETIQVAPKIILHHGFLHKFNTHEFDFLSLVSFSLKTKDKENPFKFTISLGTDYKRTLTKSVRSKENDIHLQDLFGAFSIRLSKRFFNKHEIAFQFSSFDDFYFPIFCNPYYLIEYTYDATDKMTFGFIGGVHYSDQFTLTGVLEGSIAKLFAIYKW